MTRAVRTAPPVVGLARRRMNGGMLWLYEVGASSPMTVLAGGIVAMYQTGVLGVPPAFLLVGLAFGLLLVGYVAMSRHVPHAAPGYALLARGLGPRWGVVGAVLALLAYNAIQVSLYGLFGYTLAGLVGGSWLVWAGLAWAVIAVAGVLNVALNTWIVAIVLIAELGTIAAFILAAFTHPAGGGITVAPLSVDAVWQPGFAGVVTFGLAALVGLETAPGFSEEAKHARSVMRATVGVLVFYPLFLFLAAWAMVVATGVDGLGEALSNPDSGMPFVVLDRAYGSGLSLLASMLLVTSMLTSMLAFHGTVARYVYAIAREQVLPGWLALVGTGVRAGAPVGGSLTQSAVALVVLALVAATEADPVRVLFTWLSAGAALGVLVLLILASVSAVVFFRAGRGGHESVWVRTIAPTLGVVAGVGVLGIVVANQGLLLGVDGAGTVLLPVLVAGAVVAGLLWAARLRRRQPRIYAGIGHGRPDPLAQPEARLADLDV